MRTLTLELPDEIVEWVESDPNGRERAALHLIERLEAEKRLGDVVRESLASGFVEERFREHLASKKRELFGESQA